MANTKEYDKKSYILYASYYILYILYEIADFLEIEISIVNLETIWKKYPKAIAITEELIKIEKKIIGPDIYSDAAFFKYSNPKKHLKKLFENKEIEKFL